MLRIILSMVLFITTSFALADLEAANKAYDNKDYEAAFNLYKESAEKGSAEAQYNVGVMYEDGRGVTHATKQAVAWYQKAADQGYADAQYNLGFMYDHGRGVDQDYKQAFVWYQKAADQKQEDAVSWFYYHSSDKNYKELIAQAKQVKAKQEEQSELEHRKEREELEKERRKETEQSEKERIRRLIPELKRFRAGIKEGSETNCGPVIEVKSMLIKVYFPVASFGNEHWIKRDSLFPSTYSCSFYNGQYSPPSP